MYTKQAWVVEWGLAQNYKINKKNSGLLSPKQPKGKPGSLTFFTTQEKT